MRKFSKISIKNIMEIKRVGELTCGSIFYYVDMHTVKRSINNISSTGFPIPLNHQDLVFLLWFLEENHDKKKLKKTWFICENLLYKHKQIKRYFHPSLTYLH